MKAKCSTVHSKFLFPPRFDPTQLFTKTKKVVLSIVLQMLRGSNGDFVFLHRSVYSRPKSLHIL